MVCPLISKDGKPSPCLRDRCAWWMSVKKNGYGVDDAKWVSGCAAAFAGIPASGSWDVTVNGGGRDDG